MNPDLLKLSSKQRSVFDIIFWSNCLYEKQYSNSQFFSAAKKIVENANVALYQSKKTWKKRERNIDMNK